MRKSAASLAVKLALVAALAGCRNSPDDALARAKQKAEETGAKVSQAADHAAEKVKRAAEGAADSLTVQRERLQSGLESRLSQLDAELRGLREKVEGETGAARTRGDKAITDLEKRRAEVAKRLTELKGRTGDAWDDLAQGVRRALADLESAVADAKSRFQ